MLESFAQLFQHCWGHARSSRMVYKDLWVVSFPRCTARPNIVGSCCIRLHTTANTDATTLNIVGATMLGVVAKTHTPCIHYHLRDKTHRSHHGLIKRGRQNPSLLILSPFPLFLHWHSPLPFCLLFLCTSSQFLGLSISFCNRGFIGYIFKVSILCTFYLLFAVFS